MTATNRRRVADGRWKYWSKKFYKIQINRDDSEAIIYHPTPLVKWFFSCPNHVSQQLLEKHIFQKIAEVCPPPSKKCRVVALQNYGALQLLELHEVSTSSRCLLPVRLRDLYVSLVVWICTYDPSCLFQKNKTVTVMLCDYTQAAVHLILYAFESWPCDFVSLVLLH